MGMIRAQSSMGVNRSSVMLVTFEHDISHKKLQFEDENRTIK